MELRNHPIIENLQINEDGTKIFYEGKSLSPRINDPKRKTPTLRVSFAGHDYSVAKLVCEAWNGLRDNIAQHPSKINNLKDNHYSNLEWKESPNTGIKQFQQRLTPDECDKILVRIANGEKIRPIAREYGINESTIRKMRDKNEK